jgi:hypothetical protein
MHYQWKTFSRNSPTIFSYLIERKEGREENEMKEKFLASKKGKNMYKVKT